jgi:hypothetical protein
MKRQEWDTEDAVRRRSGASGNQDVGIRVSGDQVT